MGLTTSSGPGFAGSAWDDVRTDLFAARPIEAGQGVVSLKAPYRALDQRFVPISIEAALTDARQIEAVTVIVDDNPSPVAAVFHFADHRERAALGVNIRLDEESAVRVILEASDHRLYLYDGYIHQGLGTWGLCGAARQRPAGRRAGDRPDASDRSDQQRDRRGDPAAAARAARHQAPAEHGPADESGDNDGHPAAIHCQDRAAAGGQLVWTMGCGMTLSENPRIVFDYWVNGAGGLRVRAEDTRHGGWEQNFPIGSSG